MALQDLSELTRSAYRLGQFHGGMRGGHAQVLQVFSPVGDTAETHSGQPDLRRSGRLASTTSLSGAESCSMPDSGLADPRLPFRSCIAAQPSAGPPGFSLSLLTRISSLSAQVQLQHTLMLL